MRFPGPGQKPADLAGAAAIGGGLAAETTLTDFAAGPAWANLAVACGMGAALLWRRTAPVVPAVAFVAVAAVHGHLLTGSDELLSLLLVLVVVGYAAARYGSSHERALALGGIAVGITASDIARGQPAADLLFPIVVLLAGAGAGHAVRERAREARLLAERTHELEALRAEGEQSAVLDERRRIARDLHDVVAHTVSVMVVQAAAARRTLDRDPVAARAALDAVTATGNDAVVELDRLLGLLHPDDVHAAARAPALAAVRDLAERMRTAGLEVRVEQRGTPRTLEPAADLTAYRVVQEALTNTLKHAGATVATVELAWDDDALAIVVDDDGHGGAGGRGQGARRGLSGMRERLEELGGTLDAAPGAEGGFTVRARLPLRREREVQTA